MIWLEANTERSESNSERSLGIITIKTGNCLEDSTLILLFGCLVDNQTSESYIQPNN